MQRLVYVVIFALCLSFASAQTLSLNITLDGCLIPARKDANVTLYAEIDKCAEGYRSECDCVVPVCVKSAKIIIDLFIDSGVECIRKLPLLGLTNKKIKTIVQELNALVDGWIDSAEALCFHGARSVEGSIKCFREAVSDYSQQAVDFVKYRATVLRIRPGVKPTKK